MTQADIDQIIEGIEHFIIGVEGDEELEAIWGPYIDKLRAWSAQLDNVHTDYALLSDDYKQLLLDVKSARAQLQQLQEGIESAIAFLHTVEWGDRRIETDAANLLKQLEAALLPRPPKEEQ